MDSELQKRIRARLDALNLNPFEAARAAGLERGFINDVLIGKKKSIRGDNFYRVAEVLNCTVDYLNGKSERPFPGAPPGWVGIIGSVDTDNFGTVNYYEDKSKNRFVPSILDLPSDTMWVLEVTGDGFNGSVESGSLVYYNSYFEYPIIEWMGELCILELADQRALIGRLLPGTDWGLFHIATFGGQVLMDQEVRFAGGVCAVISPWQAAKLPIREEGPKSEAVGNIQLSD
jgi:hypothetical protein